MVIIYPGIIAGGMTRTQDNFPAFRYLQRCVIKWISSLDDTKEAQAMFNTVSANDLYRMLTICT